MLKNYCPKLAKISIILTAILLFSSVQQTYALTSSTINFQGKIVRNDTGYEGLNVTTGSPACVASGADTCDFQVKYYNVGSSGTLLLTENFLNVEIGNYNGAFNLSLGSDGSPTAGSYSTFEAMVGGEENLYVELLFAPGGAGSFTETFSRMPVQASAYALRARGASTAFQFDTAANESGYTTPAEGMVYYNTASDKLRVYDGSSWVDVGGSSGTSLWTDGGIFSYLTSLTDHLVLGASSYTAIGSDSYATYVAGLSGRAPFSFDMTASRLTLSGSEARSGLSVYSDYSSTGAWPVVSIKADDSGFSGTTLEVTNDGSGDIASLNWGSYEVFAFETPGTFYMMQSSPSVTTDRLYNVGGVLYWNGSAVNTGSGSLWTDGGTFSYLTSTTDDVIIGGNSAANAKFFFDVSTGNLGIGTSTPTAKLEIGGSSSLISNSTGDITISADDTLVVKANDTQNDNLQEWQNSSGTILSLINQNGYATLGSATAGTSAYLTLGANSTTTSQIHFNSSAGTDVSAPVAGDMWWNGTELYFFDGSANIDIILGGKGSKQYSTSGLVDNKTYLDLEHGQNSYSIIANGWVCIGGSNNSACTGGYWKNVKDTDFTIRNALYNDWKNSDPSAMIGTEVGPTEVKLGQVVDLGTGEDGDITVTGDSDINATNLIIGRSCADGGDAVNYSITAFNASGTEATLSSTPSDGCLNFGDEVLIINLQGINGAIGNVGNYETLRILSIVGTTITFEKPKTKWYGDGENDTNLGVDITNQRVMLQRVPNYNNVTVNASFTFSPTVWNGVKGGVMFFKAKGQVYVSGSISATGTGYVGGTGSTSPSADRADSGECLFVTNPISSGYGDGGFANASWTAGTDGAFSGGGGGGKVTSGAAGVGGAGTSAQVACGGGGGGSTTRYSTSYGGYGGGGGGGGYATYGYGGKGQSATYNGGNGTISESGAGGAAVYSTNNYGGGGGGGSANNNDTAENKLFFGGGGGGGGGAQTSAAVSYAGGNGGNGGGIVLISGNAVIVKGTISSDGSDGGETTGSLLDGGGGGGAGGSIKIYGVDVTVGTSLVTASGGLGNTVNTIDGGNGGVGKINMYYETVSGTTTPTSANSTMTINRYGIYNSPVIPTLGAKSYQNLRWNSDFDTYGKVAIQTRSGSTSDPTDGTWEGWKPFVNGTNYVSLNDANTHGDWTGTNATVADGDVTRNVNYFEDEDEDNAGNITKITSSTLDGYAESTIVSTDLSNYDYVTFWVRSSQVSTNASYAALFIGMGESAGDEFYRYVRIDAKDKWQKVYWDISNLPAASRDGITKLRITSRASDNHTIYIDNIRGEKLLTDGSGTNIETTANDYFQYRTIFSITDYSSQPKLENIAFTYNTGYEILAVGPDDVFLYNFTGSTQYLKLDIAVGSGADLAEYYPSKEVLMPSEIVSLDSTYQGYIKKSTKEYDSNLIGVISTDPGMTLGWGQTYQDKVYKLALKGRVPVLVSPFSSDIKVGDYITSSNLPGYAMKAEKDGRVVGVALEAWTKSSGKDTVMVFVENQNIGNTTNQTQNSLTVSSMNKQGRFSLFGFNTLLSDDDSSVLGSLTNTYIDNVGTRYSLEDTSAGNRYTTKLVNNSKYPVEYGSLVAFNPNGDSSFVNVDSNSKIYGIVKGVDLVDDKDGDSICDIQESCVVSFGGSMDIKIDNSNPVNVGEYIFPVLNSDTGEVTSEYNGSLLGVVSGISDVESGTAQIVFNSSNAQLGEIYLDKELEDGTKYIYESASTIYTALSLAERRGILESSDSLPIIFDSFEDDLKTDSSTTLTRDSELSSIGGSEGTYTSVPLQLKNSSNTGYLVVNGVGDASEVSVSASNNNGLEYVNAQVIKTVIGENNSFSSAYLVTFPNEGNIYKVKIGIGNESTDINEWYLTNIFSLYKGVNGIQTHGGDEIASGKYLEVKYSNDGKDTLKALYFNITSGKWEDINTTRYITNTPTGEISGGLYNSEVIPTSNAKSYDNLKWSTELDKEGKISIQTRSGNSADPLDGTWEGWKPFVESTNFVTIADANDINLWNAKDLAILEGDTTRDVNNFEDEDEISNENILKLIANTSESYAETIFKNYDLSSYDYISLWVKSSQAGKTLRIGMGENAATEKYQDINIEKANTWQKIYWDISNIPLSERDSITKLRITSQIAGENIIYIDNVRGEKLLTDSNNSKIASTPNNYFQYRVISTQRNDNPVQNIKNISFEYSTGFSIEQIGKDTLRVHNNTGVDQRIRVDILSGVSNYSVNGISIAPTIAQVDTADNSNSIWVNKLGEGGNLLKLQTDNKDMMVVNSTGDVSLAGDISIYGGTISLGSGDNAGGIRYNSTTDSMEFSNDGKSWLPLGDISKTIVLSAEYQGAVLSGDGTNNIGNMIADSEGTDSNSMNYYEWNSSDYILNDYDVRVRFTLPSDFNTWGNTGSLRLNYATESNDPTSNKLDLYVYEDQSSNVDARENNIVSKDGGAWNSIDISGKELEECSKSGESCMFIIRMSSSNDNYVRVGDIEITYDRSL